MHGLILAGGEGTRLAADGIGGPKATVAVAAPQSQRLCPFSLQPVSSVFFTGASRTAASASRYGRAKAALVSASSAKTEPREVGTSKTVSTTSSTPRRPM